MSETQCRICGGVFPTAQIFTLDEHAVCAGCKPEFLARLLSGEPAPLEPVGLEARVLGFWETVRIGWQVVRSAWLTLLLLALLIAVPMNWLLHQVVPTDEDSMREIARAWRLEQSGQTFFGVLATLGTAWITRERLEGRRATLAGALRHAVRYWLPAIGTAIVESFFLVGLTLLLIVPGIIFAGYYTFSMIAVALRGCGGTRALSYSKTLVKGRWWRVVAYAAGFMLPVLLPVLVLSVAGEFLPTWPHLDLANDILLDVGLRLTTVFLTVLFLNLDTVQRVREATGEESILNRQLGQHHGV